MESLNRAMSPTVSLFSLSNEKLFIHIRVLFGCLIWRICSPATFMYEYAILCDIYKVQRTKISFRLVPATAGTTGCLHTCCSIEHILLI